MSRIRPATTAVLALLVLGPRAAAAQAPHAVRSPDGSIEVRVGVGERLTYDVLVSDTVVLERATLSMTVDGRALGVAPSVTKVSTRSHDGVVRPVVRQKAEQLRERYNELRLDCEGGYAVVFRTYDEGVAYRFETSLARPEVVVESEEATFRFTQDHTVYYPEEGGFFSHNERHFLPRALRDLDAGNLASLPAVVDAGVVKVAIAESDLDDYPGLWLRGTGAAALAATFPPYPLKEELRRDRDVVVTETAPYIARTAGTRSYPWRVLGLARQDGELVTSSLVYLLARPSQVGDASWIRPGKVAWDWWNANNLHGVDFVAGVNTDTYRHFIDFAAAHGIEYVILDEGWYELGNVLKVVPAMDMEALTAHARQKGVGLVLWVVWKTLADQLEPALAQFEQWGIKGIKVDFMRRDDQPVVNFYHRVSREAARRRLLVDFHGSVRPALMTRTWPNLLTVEGVRGLEWNKWSAHVHPEHDTTLPFTRMFLGPMDYTPGAMINAARGGFAPIFERPMSQGTRARQLALYVVYESPLQMLADTPTNYAREADAMAFLGPVPTVWDETRVLDARIADYVVVARRSGREWYVGAITDWTRRALDVDLAFLAEGEFEMDAFADGPNAGRIGVDYRRLAARVSRGDRVRVTLAEGGGWVARIRPRP